MKNSKNSFPGEVFYNKNVELKVGRRQKYIFIVAFCNQMFGNLILRLGGVFFSLLSNFQSQLFLENAFTLSFYLCFVCSFAKLQLSSNMRGCYS